MGSAQWSPARVDFVTLQLFCVVAQYGNLTRAAARCHLAVSAASRRLADLETAAGVRLFDRSSKGVALTPAGHAAFRHAARLLHGFEQFGREIGEYSAGVDGHVHLHSNITGLTGDLPAVVGRFCIAHPSIRVEIEERVSPDVIRGLLDRVADVGVFVSHDVSNLSAELRIVPWRTDELVVVCPPAHPLAELPHVQLADLFRYDIVTLVDGASAAKMMSEGAEHAGMTLRTRVQVRSYDALCHVVAANLGVGLCSYVWCKENLHAGKRLRVVRLAHPQARRTLFAALGPRGVASPAAQLFWKALVAEDGAHAASGAVTTDAAAVDMGAGRGEG